MPKFADDKQAEEARKRMQEDKEVVERSRAEFSERSKGKPTPTQEECDLAAYGVHILEHDEDGSPQEQPARKAMEAGKPAQYQTRAAAAAPPKPPGT